jgi:hypothetical protein
VTPGPCPCKYCNAPETCDRCHEVIGPKKCTYESLNGKDYICEECFEREHDEAEAVSDRGR